MTVVINGTTGITNVNGSAAAPAETGTDTDTGIVYGTNTVTISTNGTAGLTQDASQNLGLGVTPPTFNTGKALSIYEAGSSLWSNANGAMGIVANAYYNSGWKYQATAAAARFDVGNANGTTTWAYAASGTAGSALETSDSDNGVFGFVIS